MQHAIDQASAQVRNRTEISTWRGLNSLLQIAEEHESLAWSALDRCYRLSEEGYAPAAALLPHAPRLIALWTRLRHQIEPTRYSHWFQEDYSRLLSTASLTLDLLGRFHSPDSVRELRLALLLPDPRLRMFSILGLARHDEPFDAADLESVLIHHELRHELTTHLHALGKEYLLPPQYATPSARAAAAMAHWLCFPTELGCPPSQLEEMDRLLVDAFDEPFYVFRFRTTEPHWAARHGWMAGIVGPRGAFSCFEPWQGRTPREHCGEILSRLPDVCP